MTLEELKALYAEKGATTNREEQTEQGVQTFTDPINFGSGWSAYENQPIIGYEGTGESAMPIYGDKVLGGFIKDKDGVSYYYDTEGNFVNAAKSRANSFWENLGPIIMGAITMGGGGAFLGNSLFGLTGNAAAAAGGALAGGVNAALTDQDILKGALKGGVGSAGALQLGDTGFTLGDVNKAINFAQNPSAAGAVNLFAPSIGGTKIGDTDISLGDIFKGVGTAQALGSGDNRQIFNAITGLAKDQGGSLKSSLGPGDMDQFSADLIEGYFQPGGEGYNALMAGDTTVLEDPQNLDAFLRSISPYATDSGKSTFVQDEDIPEFETVSNRPITSIESILGTPNILEPVETDIPEVTITDKKDEPYVPGIRTKEIKSDIPDEITPDQIATLFPNLNINDILQLVTPAGTKAATPITTTTPKITAPTPGTKTTQEAMSNLGLNAPMPSQDPYANIKLMEELFGGDTAYKLRSLGAPKNLASADIDALARMLRG